MKLGHRRLLLGMTLLLLLVVASLLHPGVHWRVMGWWRGEGFYEGRPISYWREALLKFDDSIDGGALSKDRSHTFFERMANTLGFDPGDSAEARKVMYHPAATTVLLELLKDPDPHVRWLAVYSINRRFDPAKVVPGLSVILRDEHLPNRRWAAHALAAFGPNAKEAVPILLNALQEKDFFEWAADALKKIDPEAAANAGVK
ncbi:hypothetical protein AYO44_06700 [Planctomycetaceae bacterium SCGC AG-212-F19]|nr:hypothetical protein AYO44_06700 [Planctomycetaceae bacterium SCGC AG-212-F19]